MHKTVGYAGSPPAADVRAAMEHVLASAAFKAAPRLAAFLRYVVDATLSGRADRIKAYTVAVEALGRPDSFNPASDAIVRVEAGRLRRALAHHYGADRGAVIIEMPLGSYVPHFRWCDAADSASLTESGMNGDAAIAATLTSVTEEAQTARRHRHDLFAECHLSLQEIRDSLASLHAEFVAARSVMAQSRHLIERSRNGPQAAEN